jgi:1-acyl-sn-glycerol-3-phosphate acyltransferase
VLPPRWMRRSVLAPGVLLLVFLAVTTLPLWAIAAAALSPSLPGRLRPLRLLWFALVYLAVEAATLVGLFGLWIASGFGRKVASERWVSAHYRLLGWYLGALVRTARRDFNLHIDVEVPTEPIRTDVPLLVFSRHAGPGDSFLLVHELLRRGLRPRIVLKGSLRWVPVIDIGLGRIPSHFVDRGAPAGTGTAAVERLAAGLKPGDALVIFPEGRNWTEQRRTTSITRLEELGAHEEAEEARQMRYVLAPRTGGALAALRAAPVADVLFVAHTGLEDLSSIVDLWRGLPMDARVQVELWRVPADDVPEGDAARVAWLLAWWRRIDAWIVARFGEEAAPDAVVDIVTEPEDEPPRGSQGRDAAAEPT